MLSSRLLRGAMLRVACGALFTSSVLAVGIHLSTSEPKSEDGSQDLDRREEGDSMMDALIAEPAIRISESIQLDRSKDQAVPAGSNSKPAASGMGAVGASAVLRDQAMLRSMQAGILAKPSTPASPPSSDSPNDEERSSRSQRSKRGPKKWSKSKLGPYAMKGSLGASMGGRSGHALPRSSVALQGGFRGGSAYGRGVAEGRLEAPFEADPRRRYRSEDHHHNWNRVDPRRWKQRMVSTSEDTKSTFSIDVDTASYSSIRSEIERGRLPRATQVRVEEMINYFDYGYDLPPEGTPVWAQGEVGPCPWNSNHKLVHIGVQAEVAMVDEVPARNLVFLIDVSGSMSAANRLPLLKQAVAMMVPTLDSSDRISIVVYAGAAGQVLSPTSGANDVAILAALEKLQSGGSTHGSEGIELAYQLAQSSFIDGGVNRVILATDGDFNVGTTSHEALVDLISQKRKSGVYLSVLRFGHSSRSDRTMEQLADRGNGNYAYIDSIQEAHKVLVQQAGATLVPVADDVKIQVEFNAQAVRSYRLVGYENRRLAHRDFADDAKDAGEIGLGHTVTAIYEIDPQPEARSASRETLMALRLRYKHPGDSHSQLIESTITDREIPLSQTSEAFRFSAAVAEYGELLSGQRFPEGGFSQVLRLAENARSKDIWCYRAGLVRQVSMAAVMHGHPELAGRGDIACTVSAEASRTRGRSKKIAGPLESDDPNAKGIAQVLSHLCFSPLCALACILEGFASFIRSIPLWLCIFPAMLGGLLLELSNRSSRSNVMKRPPTG